MDGDKVLACPFCGGVYAQPGQTGSRIDCSIDVGGCGAAFKIQVFRTVGPDGKAIGAGNDKQN